jgi:purine catabolism regulator
MVTFEMLLKMSALRELHVVAGHGGFDRAIKAVSVMDAPDSYKWLKGGEFILTTAYLSGGDARFLELNLMNLIESGSSGLGVKRGRHLSEIPENVIEIADEHRVPNH